MLQDAVTYMMPSTTSGVASTPRLLCRSYDQASPSRRTLLLSICVRREKRASEWSRPWLSQSRVLAPLALIALLSMRAVAARMCSGEPLAAAAAGWPAASGAVHSSATLARAAPSGRHARRRGVGRVVDRRPMVVSPRCGGAG